MRQDLELGQDARRSEAGFTLVEMMVTFAAFLMIMLAVMQLYDSAAKVQRRTERRLDLQQNARLAMAEIARQIRMAGYFPENFAVTPPSPLLANPFHVATNAALAIHGDGDGSGASNVFVYCLDGTNLRTLRLAAGASIACASGEILAQNIQSLEFTYFTAAGATVPATPTPPYLLDSQGASGVPDLTTVTQRSTVRRVLITMTGRAVSPGIGTQTYTLTSDVVMRNGA